MSPIVVPSLLRRHWFPFRFAQNKYIIGSLLHETEIPVYIFICGASPAGFIGLRNWKYHPGLHKERFMRIIARAFETIAAARP